MSSTRDRLLVLGTAAALEQAAPLIAAHAAVRRVEAVEVGPRVVHLAARLPDRRATAAIILAPADRPVADVVDGPFVERGGRPVPVGVMPDDARAVRAAAVAQARVAPGTRLGAGPIALLSSRESHVRERAGELAALLHDGDVPFRDLPTGSLRRRELLAAFAAGPGVVLYTGLGTPVGWAGYGGLEAWQLEDPEAEPVGAAISLSCSGAQRRGSRHGICEELVERGVAASALGAVDVVARDDDRALGLAIAGRILGGAATLAGALDPAWEELADFRICGDPLAPFVGARGSRAALRRAYAPAVGDSLPPVDWSTVAPG
ncbi:hypothetical protein [Demequina rhizosphaerae]|uniref:hypothetical protein n=1 Tax=Demequina rhizosphaerae TaxID=1638985 RepID=UPI000782BB43|nr:hypothetical protein [Demequina rhizosphaerae]